MIIKNLKRNIKLLFSGRDFSFFGIHFCRIPKNSYSFSYGKEYFHNGYGFIPGLTISVKNVFAFQLSFKRDWLG